MAKKGVKLGMASAVAVGAGAAMMAKKVKKTVYTWTIFIATFVCMILLALFAVDFSSIFYILISGTLGLLVYTIGYRRNKRKKSLSDDESNPGEEK